MQDHWQVNPDAKPPALSLFQLVLFALAAIVALAFALTVTMQ